MSLKSEMNEQKVDDTKSVPLVISSCLDFPENVSLINQPFHATTAFTGIGYANIEGVVMKKSFSNDRNQTFEGLYFEMKKPAKKGSDYDFYDYFSEARISPVTSFFLGLYENGKMTTTATVDPAAESKIMESLKSQKPIQLKLTTSRYKDMDQKSHSFSFACKIEST